MEVQGKNVLVTGSTRGIGRTIAETFAQAGANVVINGRSQIPEDVLATCRTHGVQAVGVTGDISSFEAAKALIAEAEATLGPIDILINNAGITNDKLVLRMKEEEFNSCLQVNLTGTFNMTQQVLKGMMKRRNGCIINLASVSGLIGNVGQANYAASKAGVVGFTKSVAREVAARGITVNAIAPGFIQTEMTEVLSDKVKEHMEKQIPVQAFGCTEDVAKAALFLAQSPYITGQVLNVDGGLVMHG
jgi:3-oxoacyl-(acyl-carrier-protein) reductase